MKSGPLNIEIVCIMATAAVKEMDRNGVQFTFG